MAIVTTEQLKEIYPAIISRLDELYSKGMYHLLTESEQAEVAELRHRALLIQIELGQRERLSVPLFA